LVGFFSFSFFSFKVSPDPELTLSTLLLL